ncbi:hypothetical protein Taro_051992 [Colocasia esculenta]|uniref:Aminotransferase-like plant mobile domain-containing protein n=1 Tax=Colocasia esculenta TaxID=4460 RepID=A0A843XIC3_COLES|nr:hypothetical protein [Colocasia esculenta]
MEVMWWWFARRREEETVGDEGKLSAAGGDASGRGGDAGCGDGRRGGAHGRRRGGGNGSRASDAKDPRRPNVGRDAQENGHQTREVPVSLHLRTRWADPSGHLNEGRDHVTSAKAVATRSRSTRGVRLCRGPSWRHDKVAAFLAVYLAFPGFQRNRLEKMGFGEDHRPESAQASGEWSYLPCYRELAHRLLGLTVGQRSSLLSRVELQESLGLFETGRKVAESVDEQLQRLTEGCSERLASEPGAQADLDLCHFLTFFLGRLLFAMRGDPVHCRFLPLLEDLGQVGSYVWGAAFLAHQFESLGSLDRQTAINGFYPFLQVRAYLHLPGLRRGTLERPGLVPIARHWVVWQPYLGEANEGQLWLESARPYFGRTVWIHALNLVLPLHHYLTQRSLGLCQSVVEFPSQVRTPRPRRRFRGLHDTTDWRE